MQSGQQQSAKAAAKADIGGGDDTARCDEPRAVLPCSWGAAHPVMNTPCPVHGPPLPRPLSHPALI